jgi:hypothetical protein
MVYQWKIPELYSVSAQEAGAEIESCKNGDGFITPAAVVQRAKESTSVIHGCFEWDDARAAERYRLNQAGELIRNIVTVTVIEEEKTPLTVRAFVNIKGEDESGYKTISAVVSNCNEYEYLLRTALSDMAAFTRKYEILKELRGVMTAMKEVLADEIT